MLAPASSSTMPGPMGKIEAIAGRLTPRIRPMPMAAAAIAAPVDPADTMPTASPEATNRAAVVTEAPFFSRIAVAGSSCIPITSGACTIGNVASWSARIGSIASVSPTSTTSTPRAAASMAPRTVSKGARSPPMASRAMRATLDYDSVRTSRPL